MSQMGQTRHFARAPMTSDLHQQTDNSRDAHKPAAHAVDSTGSWTTNMRQLSKVGGTMGTHSSAIETYIRAKDENRPHLMPGAFAPDASLETRVETENISFPPASKGIEAITQVLVKDFGSAYENIYTFCLVGLLRTVRLTSGVAGW